MADEYHSFESEGSGSGNDLINVSTTDATNTTRAIPNGTAGGAENLVYTTAEAITMLTFLMLLTVFGLVANTITLLTIGTSEKLKRSVFNLFIASLCVSDMLSSISAPFSTYGLFASAGSGYPFSAIICKLHQATDFWTNIVTIYHILAFSILRLISIVFPHKIDRCTRLMGLVTIGTLWIVTFGVTFVPSFHWIGVFRGSNLSADNWTCRPAMKFLSTVTRYVYYGYPALMYVPMALVVVCSITLIVLMIRLKIEKVKRGANKADTSKEDFAILQLSLVLFSFMLGYAPEVARRLVITGSAITDRRSFFTYVVPVATLRLSECLNPLFYNISSTAMRTATKQFLSKLCPTCVLILKKRKRSAPSTRDSTIKTNTPSGAPKGTDGSA